MNKRFLMWVATLTFLLLIISLGAYGATTSSLPKELSAESKKCVECHSSTTASIYQQWGNSKHYRANVGCYECHEAKKGARGAFLHNGLFISVIVSPLDCARCHGKEAEEFMNSHH